MPAGVPGAVLPCGAFTLYDRVGLTAHNAYTVFALAGMTISVLAFASSVFRSMVSATGTSLSLESVFALHP